MSPGTQLSCVGGQDVALSPRGFASAGEAEGGIYREVSMAWLGAVIACSALFGRPVPGVQVWFGDKTVSFVVLCARSRTRHLKHEDNVHRHTSSHSVSLFFSRDFQKGRSQ